MAADDEGFLGRWSRRKTLERSGRPPEETAPAPRPPRLDGAASQESLPVAPDDAVQKNSTGPTRSDAQAAPLPTLQDVYKLTPDADFSPFVARGVPAEVRNAAVKRLFADPRYNVMDGLDIYIDDYSIPSPVPAAMLARMLSARTMKLLDDPAEAAATTPAGRSSAAGEALAESAPLPEARNLAPIEQTVADALGGTPEEPRDPNDDDADLQLQPNHAPGPGRSGSGAG